MWMANSWIDRAMLEETEVSRTRNPDSSVSPQYEDSFPGEDVWETDEEAS